MNEKLDGVIPTTAVCKHRLDLVLGFIVDEDRRRRRLASDEDRVRIPIGLQKLDMEGVVNLPGSWQA
ncbi:hypothetical protein CLOP_g19477 [Closterium sp. NIES-67]|nr:hypothetical protein CLOP_g19477 [Closterium sp. NIES-67]